MSRNFRFTALVFALSAAASALAVAQTATSESTSTKQTVRKGIIESVSGNHVVVKGTDGVSRDYNVPEGFKFQLQGRNVTVDELKPGMGVTATITEETTTTNATTTQTVTGQVMQVAPGGIVVKNEKGELKSYDAKDVAGRDITILRNGEQVPLTSLKVGDRLSGTIVTALPPQTSTERLVVAKLTPAPAPPPAPTAVAAAEPATLPKTASPLPLIGLLAGIALATALILRGVSLFRRAH